MRYSRRALIWTCCTALAALLFACDKGDGDQESSQPSEPIDHTPHLTADLMPAAVAALTLGESTQEEIVALFPGSRESVDQSLGGDMSVSIDGQPAVVVANPYWPGEPEITNGYSHWDFGLVSLAEGEAPKLIRFELRQPQQPDGSGLCDWVAETLSSHEDATVCRHTRRDTGETEHGHFYCLGAPDGSLPVEVDCRESHQGGTDILSYRLVLDRD